MSYMTLCTETFSLYNNGEVPVESPLERLKSRRYLEELIASPTELEKEPTKEPHNRVDPGGKPWQRQQKNRAERSREGSSIARRVTVETTAQNTEILSNKKDRPNKPSNLPQRENDFLDSIPTQIKMASEEDITDKVDRMTQAKDPLFSRT